MGTGAEIAVISIAAAGLAASVGSAVYSGIEAADQAETMNEAIADAKNRANRNASVKAGQLNDNRKLLSAQAFRKRDYAALQESSARATARGAAKAALEGGGRVASGGTSTLAMLEQIELTSAQKQHILSKSASMESSQASRAYIADLMATSQQYEEQWHNLHNQTQNPFSSGFASSLGTFGAGLSMTASGMSIAGQFEE